MKCLEVIELRAAHLDREALNSRVGWLLEETQFTERVRIYVNTQVETDWAIHLHHDSAHGAPGGNEFTLRLKDMLKEYGIVNHGIWMEEEF